jgi:hypothetical protein
MSASLQLHLEDVADLSGLVAGLVRALNAPTWARVEVSTENSAVSFACDTWEPLLRVRVEDALEDLLGSAWPELARWGER